MMNYIIPLSFWLRGVRFTPTDELMKKWGLLKQYKFSMTSFLCSENVCKYMFIKGNSRYNDSVKLFRCKYANIKTIEFVMSDKKNDGRVTYYFYERDIAFTGYRVMLDDFMMVLYIYKEKDDFRFHLFVFDVNLFKKQLLSELGG